MGRRALVTGAGGFVGANLCRRLLADGHEVHALVRPAADLWRLRAIANELELHPVELPDRPRMTEVLRATTPEWIFHLAAHGGYSWQIDTDRIFAVNSVGTAQLMDLVLGQGCEAFVNAGSSSEYGFKDHACHEREWIEPNSAYAVSKAAATLYGRAMARHADAPVVTLRLYSAYGPWEEPNRLMPALAVHGLRGGLPPLADPRTAHDFVHVDDVCTAFLLAAENPSIRGSVLNVGTGAQVSLQELVSLVCATLELQVEPDWSSMPARPWDTSVWVADPSRIRAELGWHPEVGLQAGFLALARWVEADPAIRRRYEERMGIAAGRPQRA